MDNLPSEIISNIVAWIPDRTRPRRKGRLAPIALISRQWQQVVEHRTFSSLRLRTTDLETFAQIFNEDTRGSTRTSALKRLVYVVGSSPRIDKEWNACSRAERLAELQGNTETVLLRLKLLYNVIDVWSASKAIELAIYVPPRTMSDLVNPEVVPTTRTIKNLIARSETICPPGMLISIASGLPALQGIDWDIDDSDRCINSISRRKKRHGKFMYPRTLRTGISFVPFCAHVLSCRLDFAKQLSSLASFCSALRTVELQFTCIIPADENTNIPSILLPQVPIDHLSQSLQELVRACKVKTLHLDGVVLTSQLFQSQQVLEESAYWANSLSHLEITFSSMAADGGWFFDRHPELPFDLDNDEYELNDLRPRRQRLERLFTKQEALAKGFDFDQDLPPEDELTYDQELDLGYEDLDYEPDDYEYGFPFRIWPSEKGEALFVDMARAAVQMRNLKSFTAGCDMPPCVTWRRFEFHYLAPHETSEYVLEDFPNDSVHVNKHRLYWRAAKSWRMSEELQRCWQQVLGRDGVIEYCYWFVDD
jgi:hypothetical protein